jgi:hypothetical protein
VGLPLQRPAGALAEEMDMMALALDLPSDHIAQASSGVVSTLPGWGN